MTQHVRTSYRRHRKTSWALVLGLGLLVAAIAIPLATGAPDKTYTMLYPSSGAVTPAPPVAGSTSAKTLCTEATYSLKVVIANTAGSAPLGSANVTFPSTRATLSGTPTATFSSGTTPSDFSITRAGNVVSLRSLALPKKTGNTTSSVTLTVSLTTTSTAAAGANITAQVKQSNDFSDSGQNPDANAFADPTFPTIALQNCTTTISGKVFLDNDGNGSFGNSNTPADTGLGGWSVALFRTSAPVGQVGSSISTASSGDVGSYTFTGVRTGADYKVCVTRSGTWSQTVPTGSTTCASPALPKGQPVNGLSGPATNVDFGVERTVENLQCGSPFTAPLIGAGSFVDYTVQLTAPPGATCKDVLVMYSYLDGAGSQWATIHPPVGSTGDELWVVERIRWKVNASGGQNPVALRYDDDPDGGYGNAFRTMKLCIKDPRDGTEFGLTLDPGDTSVMPAGETTCMIQSTDLPSGDDYDYEAYLATDVDGLKGR